MGMHTHNLATVIAFEIRRTLLKPTFWLTSLSIPLLMVALFGLTWLSQAQAESTYEAQRAEKVAFTWTDESGLVSPAVAERLGGTRAPDAAAAIRDVQEGRSQLHVSVPADPTAEPVRVVGEDLGVIESGRWQGIARDLVQDSAAERIGNPQLVDLLNDVDVTTQLWADGQPAAGIGSMIVPGLFLVMLYMSVLMLGNQMLTITVEEKENRVTEMILTTIHPSTLIVGKVIAVVAVGILQALVFLVPTALGSMAMSLLGGGASGAGADAAVSLGGEPVVFQAGPVLVAAGLFLGGFLVFTGLLVAIGSVMPTAKDAGSAFAVVVVLMFLPLYTAGMVTSDPDGLVSTVLTWFPLTTPVTALLRNALGTLPLGQGVALVAMLMVCAAILLWVGVRLFRQGSISYDQRLRLTNLWRRK